VSVNHEIVNPAVKEIQSDSKTQRVANTDQDFSPVA